MTVKRTFSALVLLLASAGPVLAEEYSTEILNFVSSRTRAEVRAELFAYKKAGVNPWSMRYNPLANFRSEMTREDVLADFFASRDQAREFYSEDSGSFFLARSGRVAATPPMAARPLPAGS